MKNNIKIVLKNLFILSAVVFLYIFASLSAVYAEKVFGVAGILSCLGVIIILGAISLSLNEIHYNKEIKKINETFDSITKNTK